MVTCTTEFDLYFACTDFTKGDLDLFQWWCFSQSVPQPRVSAEQLPADGRIWISPQLTECWSAKIFTLVRWNFKKSKGTRRTIIQCLLISEHLIAIFACRTMPFGKSSSFWQGDQQNLISSAVCTFCHASWYSHKCCAPMLGSHSQSPMQSLQLCRAPLLNSAHFHNLIVLTNLDAAQISCSFIVLGTVHINYLKGLIA